MKIYAFEGHYEVYASDSLGSFFGDDGTVIRPSVSDGRVVLTPTDENRLEELQERLRTYLGQPRVSMDTQLANDPAALAELLIEVAAQLRWPTRLRFRRPR